MNSYLSAVQCPDKDGFLLPQEPLDPGSDWMCDRCGKAVPVKTVDQMSVKFKEIGSKMCLTTVNLNEWEDYLALLQAELHPSKGKLR
jgi:hypothetical protein